MGESFGRVKQLLQVSHQGELHAIALHPDPELKLLASGATDVARMQQGNCVDKGIWNRQPMLVHFANDTQFTMRTPRFLSHLELSFS